MHDLNDLRNQLDSIDNQIVELLSKRFEVTQKVGEHKRDNNLPAIDLAREALQFERIQKLAKEHGLNPEFAAKYLRLVIDEVVSNHKKIIGS